MPLLWVYERYHILVLGVPNNRLTCMQGQKTLSLSYNMHLFLTYWLNESQTIRSMINFSKPLLCVTLICGDWSDWSHFHFIMPVKVRSRNIVITVITRYQLVKNVLVEVVITTCKLGVFRELRLVPRDHCTSRGNKEKQRRFQRKLLLV